MNFPLDSVGDMPEEAKQALAASLEHMQIRDSLRMYNSLVERCFRDCTEDMRSKSLSRSEETCVSKCCEKFMSVTSRVGVRFQEFFSQMEVAAQAQVQQQIATAKAQQAMDAPR